MTPKTFAKVTFVTKIFKHKKHFSWNLVQYQSLPLFICLSQCNAGKYIVDKHILNYRFYAVHCDNFLDGMMCNFGFVA